MNNMELFNDITDECSSLFKQFIDLNPIGALIVNENLEIVNMNECVKNYFDGDARITEFYFGNIFNCHVISIGNEVCGTKDQCTNCKIRKSMLNSLETNRTIKTLNISKNFMINGVKKVKWFDLTIVPVEIRSKRYLWLSLIDLTELMKSKIEIEMKTILNDEENAIDKDQFHEDVMNCIRTHCYSGGEAYLTIFELKHTKTVQESFGALWRNDYLSSFHNHLKDNLESTDFICRYSMSQFMVFLPCKEDISFKLLINKINDYQYSHFNTVDGVDSRTIKFKMNSENIQEIINSDQLYIEYFKAISTLEKLESKDTIELIF